MIDFNQRKRLKKGFLSIKTNNIIYIINSTKNNITIKLYFIKHIQFNINPFWFCKYHQFWTRALKSFNLGRASGTFFSMGTIGAVVFIMIQILNILMILISFILLISSGIIWTIWNYWRRIRSMMTYIIFLWAKCQPWNAFVSILVEIWLYNLKNILFLRVNLGEPSIIIKNWSCGVTSIATPLLSHLH